MGVDGLGMDWIVREKKEGDERRDVSESCYGWCCCYCVGVGCCDFDFEEVKEQ